MGAIGAALLWWQPASSPPVAAAPKAQRPATKLPVPAPPVTEPPAPATPAELQAAFLEALKRRNAAERDREAARTLREWLAKDFEGAFAQVSAMPAGALPIVTAPEVARAFAGRDPAAALAWVKTITDPHVQRLALHHALEVWAEKDAVAAGRHVAEMEPGPTQMSAAAEVARAMAVTDAANAIAWAQKLSNSSARDFALTGIASAWAQREPAAAAKWASELPAGETRAEALNGALTYWVLNDAPAAQKFVAGLTGEVQTRAAAFIAPMLVQTNPRTAAEWSRSLAHPDAREAALAAVYERWRDLAPKEAEDWLKAANLPATTKTKLQKRR